MEDVFDIKTDKAEIKLMLQQLKRYCGGNILLNYAIDLNAW